VDSSNLVVDLIRVLVIVNGGTFIAILTFGWKIVRFVNTIEFKTDLMWTDYRRRVESSPTDAGYIHRRRGDVDQAHDDGSLQPDR
jgi:hypothetical protein